MPIARLIWGGYCVALTVLLLTPNPLRLLGIQRLPGPPGGCGIHFVLFTVMTFLAYASRWPIRGAVLAGVLIGYGILTETLQRFFPPRTVELLDYVENVVGVLVGAAIWWAFQRQQIARKAWQDRLEASPEAE